MQPIDPVTIDELLGPVQVTLYEIEVWDDVSWISLRTYLKTVNFNLGSASMTPDPVAASWSAEIDNSEGIFHPFHPTSEYANLFRIGRKIRIFVGATYDDSDHYWPRLTGYMDAPTFNHEAKTITLKGMDFMKRLADTILRSPSNHWGALETLSSVASDDVLGSELYAYSEADAVVNNRNDFDNMTNWSTTSHASAASVEDDEGSGDLGGYNGQVTKTAPGYPTGWVGNEDVCSVTVGKLYKVSFRYKRVSAGCTFSLRVMETATTKLMGKSAELASTSWTPVSFYFTATKTCAIRLAAYITGSGTDLVCRFDLVSIKEVISYTNTRYNLPLDTCNGPYYVVLNGVALWYGQTDPPQGWLYDEAAKIFYFADGYHVDGGTDNLLVYYYTDQLLENILADLLANGPGDAGGGAGLYVTRAEALAAMDYTPTGITIPRVWFPAENMTALAAVKLICERADYRFWFAFDGTPCFKPTPVAGSPVFTFPLPAHVQDPGIHQDRSEIRNRIVIEGIEQAMYAAREDKRSSCLAGEVSDEDSIAAYLEKTHSIKNHLFQDQASIDAMTATLLAAFKDPKWYAEIKNPYNPVPLEFWDTIAWQEIITQNSDGTWLVAAIIGIIRNIRLNNSMTIYELEISSYEILAEGAHILLDGDVHFDTEYGPAAAGSMIVADGDPEVPLEDPGPGEHALLNGLIHPDTLEQVPIVADMVFGGGSPPKWTRLPAGTENQILEMGVTLPGWGRKITISASDPSGGSDGDIWLKY